MIVIYVFFKLLYYFVCWDYKKKETNKEIIYESLKGHELDGHPVPINLFCGKMDYKTKEGCYKAFW